MSGLANFSVDTTDPLDPVVLVNGEKVQGYQRVSLDCSPGAVPVLYLEYPAEAGLIVGSGIVTQRFELPDAVDALTEFFNAIDPGELEQAMLEQFDGLTDCTTGQAALNVLKGWVAKRGQ